MPISTLFTLASASVIIGVSGLAPGATVRLPTGVRPMVTINGQTFDPPVTIIATGADVAGLRISRSKGIIWRGGTIRAPGGKNGGSPIDRGVQILSSQNIRFDGVTFTGAKNAMVVDESDGLTVINSRFVNLRSDGIDVAGVSNVRIESNDFSDFTPILPVGRSTEPGYVPGDHPDAIQFWQGSAGRPASDVIVRYNRITGTMQGIGNFGPYGTGHLRMTVEYNQVKTWFPNGISIGNCRGCTVRFNSVEHVPGGPYRANASFAGSTGLFCGNRIPDVPNNPGNLACPPAGAVTSPPP